MTLTPRPAAIAIVLSLGLLALYLAFPTKAYYWDGIVFAQAIEDAPNVNVSLAHPNHLVYNFAGYLFYRVMRAVGLSENLRALTALQIFNSILSAGCASILFLILHDTLRSTYLNVCLTLLFALSATWWKFSTDANAYVPSVLFLLVSFYLVLPDRKPRPVLLALSFFSAMCFHELAVIAFPVFALGVYLQDGSIAIRRRIRNAILFALLSAGLIAAAYTLVFYQATGSLDVARLLRWAASYSADADTSFNPWSSFVYSLRGEVRLFFGGRVNLLRGLMNPLVWLLIVLFVSAVVLLIVSVVSTVASMRSRLRGTAAGLWPRQKTVLLLALVWAVVYLVFLFFWLPQNTFYRLFYLPALIVLLGLVLEAWAPLVHRRTFAIALFVAAVGLANFLFMIFPFSQVEKYPPLEFALELQREWPVGTVIYYDAQNSDEALVRYFTPGTQWKLLGVDIPKENDAWLETTAIDRLSSTPDGNRWLQTHTNPASVRELNNGAYRLRFIQLRPQ